MYSLLYLLLGNQNFNTAGLYIQIETWPFSSESLPLFITGTNRRICTRMHFISDSLTLTYLASLVSLILTEDAGTAASCQVRGRERPRPDRRHSFKNLAQDGSVFIFPGAIDKKGVRVKQGWPGKEAAFSDPSPPQKGSHALGEWFLQTCNWYFGMLAYLFCLFFPSQKWCWDGAKSSKDL